MTTWHRAGGERPAGRRRGPRRLLASLVAVGLTGALLAACGGGDDSAGGDAPDVAENQTITIGVSTLQQQYADPVLANEGGNTYPVKWTVGEPLSRWDMEAGKVPALATEWSASEDGLTWTISLRDGVTMHDGSDFTAQDVATSIERVKNPDFTSYAAYSKKIAAVEVVDDLTIKVTTTVPYANLVFDTPPPIATAYYEEVGEEEFRANPVAAGPWKFESQTFNDSMTFTRFDDFWDEERVANFSTLILKIVPEESSRIAGLQSGQLDVIHGLTLNGAKQLEGQNGVEIVSSPGAGNATVQFPANFFPEDSPFKDERVRRALLMAVDREAIAESLFGDYASVTPNLTVETTLGNDTSLEPVPYDPEGAKELLEEAGAADLSFTYTTGSQNTIIPEVQKYSEALIGYWTAIGLDVTLDVQDTATYLDRQVKHQHTNGPIWIGSPSLLISDPEKLSIFFASTGAYSPTKDPELDALFASLSSELDPAAQEEIAGDISRMLYEKLYSIPIISVDTLYAIGPKVASFETMKGNPYAGPFWYLRAY